MSDNVNQMRFLVTWITAVMETRGQATRLKDDAKRMYDFVREQGAVYAEIRKIGSITMSFDNRPEPTTQATEETADKVLRLASGGKIN